MPVATLIAIFAHAILILGVGFSIKEINRSNVLPMEIVFLQETSAPPLDDAALLANVDHDSPDPDSQAGIGLPEPLPTPETSEQIAPSDSDVSVDSTAAAGSPATDDTATELAAEREITPETIETPPPSAMPDAPPTASDPQTSPSRREPQPSPQTDSARADAKPNNTVDVAALMRQGLSSARDPEQTGLRRQGTTRILSSTSARSAPEAAYLENWTRRVETIGNLNYPEEARRRGLSGQLVVAARIRSDGSLVDAHIQQSSGEPILDQAALDIVRLAAPFQAFPEAMRAHHDEILIVRAWNFRRDRVF
ncbi:MAG: TonB family protein [Thioalkalivibrionaceae bacterium]